MFPLEVSSLSPFVWVDFFSSPSTGLGIHGDKVRCDKCQPYSDGSGALGVSCTDMEVVEACSNSALIPCGVGVIALSLSAAPRWLGW